MIKRKYTPTEAVRECIEAHKDGIRETLEKAIEWHEQQHSYDTGQNIAHEVSAAHFRRLLDALQQEEADGEAE